MATPRPAPFMLSSEQLLSEAIFYATRAVAALVAAEAPAAHVDDLCTLLRGLIDFSEALEPDLGGS